MQSCPAVVAASVDIRFRLDEQFERFDSSAMGTGDASGVRDAQVAFCLQRCSQSCKIIAVDSIANQADVVMASHIVLGETLPTIQTLVTLYTALVASQATFAGWAERAAFFPDIGSHALQSEL